MGWFWSATAGLLIGGLGTLLPFYFHALNDWDLADKTTLFPKEMGNIVLSYSQYWICGAVIGATVGLAIYAATQKIRQKQD